MDSGSEKSSCGSLPPPLLLYFPSPSPEPPQLCNIGVFLSRDRGETWRETNLTGQMWSLQAVAPDATSGKGAVFVLVSTNNAYGPLNGTALQRTRDYGASFTVEGNFSVYANVPGYPFPAIATVTGIGGATVNGSITYAYFVNRVDTTNSRGRVSYSLC